MSLASEASSVPLSVACLNSWAAASGAGYRPIGSDGLLVPPELLGYLRRLSFQSLIGDGVGMWVRQ